jgi:hypothetical protein
MPRASNRTLRFVRALLGGGEAVLKDGVYRAQYEGRQATLEAAAVRELVAEGVLAGSGPTCRAHADARGWVRRQLLEEEERFAGQHRVMGSGADGTVLNLAESPLARLAVAAGGEPFLGRHQVEAGERVRRLAERARLQPRVTMSYSAAHVASGGMGQAAEIGDLAVDARRALADIHRLLPRDCAGVVIDVCALLKGLQQVESERGWPRRSAKLVLRIGLEQLAQHFGLAPVAVGGSARTASWMDGERPPLF